MGLLCWKMLNKLRWYPQQPQCFIVANLSEACCEAKRWKPRWTCWNLTWPCTKDSQNLLRDLLRNPLNLTWLCTKASWNLLRNLLRTLTWLCTKASQTFSRNLLRIPVEPDLAAPKPSSPSPLTRSAPKPPGTFPGTFSGTFFGTLLKHDLTLHQGFLEPFLERFSEPCWTWPGSAPKPPRPSPEPFPEPSPDTCWTWPGCTKASQPFSGTFSGTLLNLTWLCTNTSWNLLRNLLRNPVDPDLALHQSLPDLLRNLRNLLRNLVEPDLAPAPVHAGAILGWRHH